MVSRSAVVQDRQAAERPAGVRDRGLQQPDEPRADAPRRVASSNRSLAYSSTPSMPAGVPSAARRSISPSDRSNFALAVATGCGVDRKPRQLQRRGAGLARLERQHHLEQRMPRQRPRRVEHLDQPLERQLLMRVGRKVARPAPGRSARGSSGCPTVSVRSTSVLTKNPIRSSSAASVRPAIGLPIAMSVPAPSRLSSPASPACSTMNRLAPAAPAPAPPGRGADRLGCCSGTWPPRWLDTAGRGRSAGSSICSGRSCSACRPERTAAAPCALSASPSSPSTACCHSV